MKTTTFAAAMAQPLKFSDLVLFEDDHYVVVNKPSGLSTLDDRHEGISVLELAREALSDPQVGHRLDKETTGCLVIAKDPEAYRQIAMQFEDRAVTKVYHALVDGIHEFKGEEVTLPLTASNKGMVRVDRMEGKFAQTFMTSIEGFRAHTLVECVPITGRMHQIRVHLAALGASITGDDQYGGKPLLLSEIKRKFNLKKHTEELPLIRRVALHARTLSFHRLDGELVTVEAPYPKDFAVALKQLKKNR